MDVQAGNISQKLFYPKRQPSNVEVTDWRKQGLAEVHKSLSSHFLVFVWRFGPSIRQKDIL